MTRKNLTMTQRVAARYAEHHKEAQFTGSDVLNNILDKRAVGNILSALSDSGDKQSLKLFREMRSYLIKQFTLPRMAQHGLNRLLNLAIRAKTMDEGNLRNQLFKAADEMGLSLPSGMFASSKEASNGYDILMGHVLDEGVFQKLMSKMFRENDSESAELLTDVLDKLSGQMDIPRGSEQALGRLQQVFKDGLRWDVSLLRNNIFKAAASMGMKLPSGSF